MNKVADYLQDHIRGDVSVSVRKRQHFAGDASVYKQVPQIIVAPLDEQDVRKVTRFAWQLAERGKILPIVTSGGGTDFGGGAVGQAVVLSTKSHMNKILEFDDKHRKVMVEPGANFGKLQHTLSFSHGSYVPAYPSSLEYSTVGGAIANNSGGERSLRNGPMSNFVQSLHVVLANGDVIETGRITKKEASKKMGLATFEGEIYRAVDGLLSENHEAISSYSSPSRGGVGFNLKSVRSDNGSVDLTPLFVGAQGTLGIITQATIETEAYRPDDSVVVFVLRNRTVLDQLTTELLGDKVLNLEYIDNSMIELARRQHSSFLKAEIGEELPGGVLLAEFPKMSSRALDKLIKKYYKQFADAGMVVVEKEKDIDFVAQKLKALPSVLLSQQFGDLRLVPGIDDAMVPVGFVDEFIKLTEQLFKKLNVSVVVHGRVGEGIVHAYPLLDLGQLGDRQKLQRLIADYYKLVLSSQGSVVGEYGAGRTRGAFAREQLGDVLFGLMHRVKQIFDPYGILNPGVKIDVDPQANHTLIASDYDISELH